MYKFNEGNGAVVCDLCGKLIRTGEESQNFWDICDDCQKTPSHVDNFDLLAQTLVFDNSTTFYWVQIIKRRKDNPGMHSDYVCFKDYCIYSIEQLMSLKEEMIKISMLFNARVVLWVNKRDTSELTLWIATHALEYFQSKQFNTIHQIFAHTCGEHKKKEIQSNYIIDIDSRDSTYLNKIIRIIFTCSPQSNNKEDYILVPTVHGYHIICPGFNITKFIQDCLIEKLVVPDIQKDNPTVLYFNPQ